MHNGNISLDKLRICHNKNPGMRKYMEDEISIENGTTDRIPTTYLGVFDGHGGKEAAIYARDNLFDNLKSQPGFFDDNPENVKEAIRQGFIKTHMDMFKIVDTWPKRKDGHLSTSGTTATVVILRESKIFIGHVGDSAAVIAQKKNNAYIAKELTVDHKPECVKEKTRIEKLGGRVSQTNRVPRVVWKRAVTLNHSSTPRFEYVPFLAVSRALGDLWSYDESKDKFIVSPEPDVHHIDLNNNTEKNKFIILASDGLWGVMNSHQAVKYVCNFELNATKKKRNCSKNLVEDSLSIWQQNRHRADNISAIVVFLDDEFLPESSDDEDTDSIASSEADTVIITRDDDTPPMSGSENLSSLVRQIALPFGVTKKGDSSSSSTSGVFSSAGDDDKSSTSHNDVVGEVTSPGCHQKRKLPFDETTSSSSESTLPSKCKKVKHHNSTATTAPIGSISPPLNSSEDSHQCTNVITVLSAESLSDLQLDEEDIGFVDEERTRKLNSNKSLNHQSLSLSVPQAAK